MKIKNIENPITRQYFRKALRRGDSKKEAFIRCNFWGEIEWSQICNSLEQLLINKGLINNKFTEVI